jgi:hypothetical protein
MDDGTPGQAIIGPCSECGRPLPVGTMRYCVHCGAEVAGDHPSPAVVTVPSADRPGATWSTGEFRAPSPLDGVTELPPVLPPALPPTSGDAWYSDAWYAEDPASDEPAFTEPALPEPLMSEPPSAEPAADDTVSADVVPDAAPFGQAFPEAPFPQAAPFPAAPQPFPQPLQPFPQPLQPFPQPSAWPQPPASPQPFAPATSPAAAGWPVANGGGFPQSIGDAAMLPVGLPGEPTPPPVGSRPGRLPVLPLAAAALVLVVVTTFGLLWLNARGPARETAAQVAAPAVTATGATAPNGTVGAAADVTPSAPSGAANDESAVGETSASATPATADVPTALDALLDESESARGDVASTAVNLQSCRVPASQAESTFRRAGSERARLASEATALPAGAVAAVPGGGDAVRAFIALQHASAQADVAFADWAAEVATSGCHGQAPHTPDWDLANRYSGQASTAKSRFVRLWNPIAAQHDLKARSADAI